MPYAMGTGPGGRKGGKKGSRKGTTKGKGTGRDKSQFYGQCFLFGECGGGEHPLNRCPRRESPHESSQKGKGWRKSSYLTQRGRRH